MLGLLATRETHIKEAESKDEQAIWITAGAYFVVCYVISLRGPESFLLDLKDLRKYFSHEPDRYVTITFLGTVKGEHQAGKHLLPSVNITASGIKVRDWIYRLIKIRKSQGLTMGPAICDAQVKVLTSSNLNERLHEGLRQVLSLEPSLFLRKSPKMKILNQSMMCCVRSDVVPSPKY